MKINKTVLNRTPPERHANGSAATIRRRQRLWRDKLEQPHLAFLKKDEGAGEEPI